MPSRTLLITLLVLASTVLLSRAYPKAQENEEELKETKRVLVEEEDDHLLESALAATDIPEEMKTTAELNEGNIGVLKPATSRRWKRFARQFEKGIRRGWGEVKPYIPLIMHGLFPELMDSVAAEMGLPEEEEEKTHGKRVFSASRPVERSVRRAHIPQAKISKESVVPATKTSSLPSSSSQSQNSVYRIKYYIVLTGICMLLR
ncbi:unnamed protein product [Dibothriocephalus latus]|uniref:Uncharacterized protein n=1 Tax=Dibothriocephalus latus TaxID=60516 RepID=A0A3P7LKX5_DIBLA|nr:unnamed protein product [Dibothriocephalus latus]